MKAIVMKFGGASVQSLKGFERVARIIEQKKANYAQMIIVVSAMAHMTDDLLALAMAIHSDPPKRELDMLLSVGERVSMSLLAMALTKRGLRAISFTGSQSGIITNEEHTDAKIIDVRPRRLEKLLEEEQIVIVAGYQGVSLQGQITTLGRGGGDTTAVALGVAFGAEMVEFYKDVQGMYDSDPKKNVDALLYSQLEYGEALKIVERGGRILHPRAIHLAFKNKLPLHIRTFKSSLNGTFINGPGETPSIPQYEMSLSEIKAQVAI